MLALASNALVLQRELLPKNMNNPVAAAPKMPINGLTTPVSVLSFYNPTSVHVHSAAAYTQAEQHYRRVLSYYFRNSSTSTAHIMYVSWPYLQPRNTLRRPDLLHFVRLFDPFCDLKLVLVERSICAAVVSAVRRGFTSNFVGTTTAQLTSSVYVLTDLPTLHTLTEQARIIDDNMSSLMTQLQALDPQFYKRVCYEELCGPDGSKLVREIAQWARLRVPNQVS